MNEVTTIHLGRTAFTVAADAYTKLKSYLSDIQKWGGKEVAEEVELRMAELLHERGVKGEKVVLIKDVEFLQAQLGEPRDFSEQEEATSEKSPMPETTRRLFRDTDHAMVAGVASGLANYFGIDPIVVRIIFIALTFLGASGVLIYLLLWLLVPEAKSTTDRLSMQGKAPTVDNLKQLVERADVPGAARRSGSVIARILSIIGSVLLFILGLPLVIAGGLGLLGTVASGIYLLMNGMRVAGHVVAPIGGHEVAGFIAGVVTLLCILLTVFLVGVAMLRRRWQLPAWGVAALFGVFFATASIGGAFAADAIPHVRGRVEALHHSQTVQVGSFTQAVITGDDLNIEYIPDSKTYVRYEYYGTLLASKLHTSVSDNTLDITAGNIANGDCNSFCTNIQPGLEVDIHAPSLTSLTLNGKKFNGQDSRLDGPEPVFFGWHPQTLQHGTVEYSSLGD